MGEKKYIEQEAALHELCYDCSVKEDCDPVKWPCAEYARLKAIEAADVRPVERGKWLRITEYEGEGKSRKEAYHYDVCSVCKETATAGSNFWDNRTPFCPWCGAKLEES